MTADCMGELEEPANCANDIFAFLALSGNSGEHRGFVSLPG